MGKIIGIDLGNTKSSVAVLDGDGLRVLKNGEDRGVVPSVVAYTEYGEILVGAAALEQAIGNPERTLSSVKRLMGRRYDDPTVRYDRLLRPCNLVAADNGDAWVSVGDKSLAPPQILAEVLKSLKRRAESALREKVTAAVITCPASFNTSQRQAVKDAGRLAGLEVRQVLNEPTAAALAYAFASETDKVLDGRRIAVYDLGSSSFDFSLIEIDESNGGITFEVLASCGDNHLGGDDIDNLIINYLVEDFGRSCGIDLRQDKGALQRLKVAAEKAKIELSSFTETEINLPFIAADVTGPKHLNITITRGLLEYLSKELISKTLNLVRTAFAEARLPLNAVSDVVLVGAQTRMPLVQRLLVGFLGRAPRREISADEAVVLGAAVAGGIIAVNKRHITVRDVIPFSLGLETPDGRRALLFDRGTTIPARMSLLASADNHSDITINLLQGERNFAADCRLLGQLSITDIESVPRSFSQVEIAFELDSSGLVHVSAQDDDTGREYPVAITYRSGLTDSAIESMTRELKEQTKTAQDEAAWEQQAEDMARTAQDADTLTQEADVQEQKYRQRIEQLEQEIQSVRKRTVQEVESVRIKSLEQFINSMIPVYDALEKALEYTDPDIVGISSTLDGIKNTIDLFVKELNTLGVEVIDPTGQPFDPKFHEAVSVAPSNGAAKSVVKTLLKGFVLKGRVVRAAMVVVSV